ncbi:MAG: type II toxin-antitoxin system ParD family antitoxin [Bifidobacteriaceae bacterium]|jgi:antitoxin ParD1/3/4|nr:type II toxin-antitoxin system ParD family antitoxin [Bifidobacteriaceae bacterium]
MATMNVSLPSDLRDYVTTQVDLGGYVSASEFVRALIRRQRDVDHLRATLLEGATSPTEGSFDADYFNSLRERIAK